MTTQPYATQAEFLDQSIPSSAFADVPGIGAKIDTALIWASSYVNSYIKKRLTLPLQSWSEDLKNATCAVAARSLIRGRGIDPSSGNNKEILDWYKETIDWLKDIRKGECELDTYIDATQTVEEAGPLAQTDTIVDWNYSTRSSSTNDDC